MTPIEASPARSGTTVAPSSIWMAPTCAALRKSSILSSPRCASTLTCPSNRPVLARITSSLSSSIIARKPSWGGSALGRADPSGKRARNEQAAHLKQDALQEILERLDLVHVGRHFEDVAKALAALVEELDDVRGLEADL